MLLQLALSLVTFVELIVASYHNYSCQVLHHQCIARLSVVDCVVSTSADSTCNFVISEFILQCNVKKKKKKKVCKKMSKGDLMSTHLTPSHTASSRRYGSRPYHVRNAVRVREETGRSWPGFLARVRTLPALSTRLSSCGPLSHCALVTVTNCERILQPFIC